MNIIYEWIEFVVACNRHGKLTENEDVKGLRLVVACIRQRKSRHQSGSEDVRYTVAPWPALGMIGDVTRRRWDYCAVAGGMS